MKAALISLGSESSIMTAEAMKKYFDEVDMLQLRNIDIKLGKDGGVFYQGEPFKNYDCVYVKGSFRYAPLLRSIASLLKDKVPYMPIPAHVFTIVHNKLLTHLALQQKNIPMPKTYLSPTIDEAKQLLQSVHYPIVMKFPEGTQGRGVMFADSHSSASSLLDALGALNQPFIIQQYVETGGTDIRAFILGEKVVASMKRVAQADENRANLHAGGSGEPVQLDMDTMNLAVAAAKALGSDICGIDILQGPLGPVVIEANLSPGLQGLNAVSTLDVPDQIAKFLFRKTQEVVNKNNNLEAHNVIKEMEASNSGEPQQIITELMFRGDRIILPELANKIARLSPRKEYSLKVKRGRIEIEESGL
jgi:ribosomal protein S6--L-glutamate ligase